MTKVSQIVPKWHKSETFLIGFSTFGLVEHVEPKCTESWSENVPDLSNLGPIWTTFGQKSDLCTRWDSKEIRVDEILVSHLVTMSRCRWRYLLGQLMVSLSVSLTVSWRWHQAHHVTTRNSAYWPTSIRCLTVTLTATLTVTGHWLLLTIRPGRVAWYLWTLSAISPLSTRWRHDTVHSRDVSYAWSDPMSCLEEIYHTVRIEVLNSITPLE